VLKIAFESVSLPGLRHKKYQIGHRFYWLLLLGTILNLSMNSVLAQDAVNKIAINRNLMTKPLTIKGISGGTITATEIIKTENTATGSCDGFARRQPNHVLQLDSFFKSLKIEVESTADTTILIRGPGGVWCNDDSENANPMIEGEWQPGVYQVWIGSYRANANNNYRLKITGNK
jgi:hypothetical protein